MKWVWPIRRLISTPAKKGLLRYFKSPELLDLFHSNDTLMSVLVPIGLAFTGDFQSLPAGGGEKIAEWLMKLIVQQGGAIRLNSPVAEVLLNDRRVATGVRLDTGQIIHATYVVAACDSHTLFSEMLPPHVVPQKWRRRIEEADLYHSSFSIYLGLDCPPAALGLNEELVHLTDDAFPPSARVSGEAHSTTISVLAPSFRDPSLALPGKGTIQIQCPAYLSYQDRWKTGPNLQRGAAYNTLKKEYAEVLLDRVEKNLIPGLRQHIEEMSIATPVTFYRYTRNLGGGIMGFRPTQKNIRARLAQIKTPIRNLLLGGQWATYGGGVPIATQTAVNASLLILCDLRPEAFADLKAVVDGRK
jgi:phytoene dehydrogenase-like protein